MYMSDKHKIQDCGQHWENRSVKGGRDWNSKDIQVTLNDFVMFYYF